MNVSAAGSTAFSAHVQRSAVARPQAPALPVDSDGDHDGSTAASGHFDVKA
jgi:hypothetical protein